MAATVAFDIGRASKALLEADDLAALRYQLASSYDELGFDDFSFGALAIQTFGTDIDSVLTTWNASFRDEYNENWLRRDPNVLIGLKERRSVIWSSDDRHELQHHKSCIDFLEAHEARAGLNVPLVWKDGVVSGVCISSRKRRIVSEETANVVTAISAIAFLKSADLKRSHTSPEANACDPVFDGLTARQNEILKWMAQGKSNGDIATILGLSKRGVDYHVSTVLQKVGVASRAQAIVWFASHQSAGSKS